MYEAFAKRLKEALDSKHMTASELCTLTGIPKSAISQYLSGSFRPKQTRTDILAQALNVDPAWLMGYDVPMERRSGEDYISPDLAEKTVFLNVMGEIAAGYNCSANENWDGEKIEIPESYLRGYSNRDFFVLKVHGDSMYPTYMDGDYVVIRKTNALDYSGQIGAVIYDDECATLKRVEYVMGENWMRLVPINPSFPPKMIRDEGLEHCRIIGVPFILIREIEK